MAVVAIAPVELAPMRDMLQQCQGRRFHPDLGSDDHFWDLLGASCRGEMLVTEWKSSPAKISQPRIHNSWWPMLSPGPLTTALSRLPSWMLRKVMGKEVREKEKRKGCEDEGWGNGSRPRLGGNRPPWAELWWHRPPWLERECCSRMALSDVWLKCSTALCRPTTSLVVNDI